MFQRLIHFVRYGPYNDGKRDAIMAVVRRATDRGYCVILGEIPEGTTVIVLCKEEVAEQLEEILEKEGVEL